MFMLTLNKVGWKGTSLGSIRHCNCNVGLILKFTYIKMKGPNKSSNIKKNIGIFKFLSHIQKDLTKKVIIQKITKTVNGMVLQF